MPLLAPAAFSKIETLLPSTTQEVGRYLLLALHSGRSKPKTTVTSAPNAKRKNSPKKRTDLKSACALLFRTGA